MFRLFDASLLSFANGLRSPAQTGGFSRIYLQVHWPTDVLAGYLTGIAAALLVLIFKIRFGKMPK